MKKSHFLIINTIQHFIEFSLIYLLLQSLISSGFFVYMSMAFILVLSSIIMVSQFHVTRVLKSHATAFKTPLLKNIEEMIDGIDSIQSSDFLSINIPSLPAPAMYSNGKIYINEAYKMAHKNFDALLAHEIGHFISANSYKNPISMIGYASLRPSFYIARLFKSIRSKLIYQKKLKQSSLMDYLLSWPTFCLMIINDMTIYRWMRFDEQFANDQAIKLGFGHELRTYYYEMIRLHQSKDYLDFEHPTTRKMIEKMNAPLGMDDDLIKDVYLRKGVIVYVDSYYSQLDKRTKELRYWMKYEPEDGYTLNHIANLFYNKGQSSEDDLNSAIYYYNLAIQKGYAKASSNLGRLFETKDDYKKAILAYESGLKLNDLGSTLRLAQWYKSGSQIKKDLEKSYQLFVKAAQLGHKDSTYIKEYINQTFVAYKSGDELLSDIGSFTIKLYMDGRVEVINQSIEFSPIRYIRRGRLIDVYDECDQLVYQIRLLNHEMILYHIIQKDQKQLVLKKDDKGIV